MSEQAALDGLRVLEISTGPAAATAAMHLADFGADVVKAVGEDYDIGPSNPGGLCWDRNKRLTLAAMTSGTGLADLRRLANSADMVITDAPLPHQEQYGLDGPTLLTTKPDLIHVSMPPSGGVGRWSQLPADSLLFDAVFGSASLHMSMDDVPVACVTPVLAYTQGALGAAAAAAALIDRSRTGCGQSVEVSALHAAAAQFAAVVCDIPGVVRPIQRGGGSMPNFRLYQCQDGAWLYLAALSEPFFLQALNVLDLVEIMVLPGVEGRLSNLLQPELGLIAIEQIAARFAEHSRDHWRERLDRAGVPNGPVLRRDEWWRSDVVASVGMRAQMSHPDLGTVEIPGLPVTLSETPASLRRLPAHESFVDTARLWLDSPRPLTKAVEHDGLPPLTGIRVLDLGAYVAGPFAASILADFGAEVTKVETVAGDPYRLFPASFLAMHKCKRNIVLDITRPTHRQALYDLTRRADVLVDNLRPGARETLKIDWISLQKVNPRLVRGTITAWGVGNSLSMTPAFDPLMQARSGLIDAQGGDGRPVTSGMLVHDIGTGILAAFGILVGLISRDRSGQGQEVSTVMAASSIMMQAAEFTVVAGRAPPASGGRDHPGPSAVHRYYACADGWLGLAATTDPQVAGLGRALRLPSGEAWLTAPNRGDTATVIAHALSALTVERAIDLLAGEGVPAAPVLGSYAQFTDPWLAQNRLLEHIDDPNLGPSTVIRAYANWSQSAQRRGGPVSAAGFDSASVLAEVGYDNAHIAALLAEITT